MCIKAMRLDSTNLKDRMIQLVKSTSPEITKKNLINLIMKSRN